MSFGPYGLPLEFWSYKRLLGQVLVDHGTTLQWCKKKGLLSNRKLCPACNQEMLFVQRSDGIDGYRFVCFLNHTRPLMYYDASGRWRCSKHGCRRSASIRQKSCFSRSHLSLGTILELTYLWSEEFPVHRTVKWCGVSEKTVIDWYNFCRDTCAEYMRRNPTVIGGPGKIVEIDEAKFGKRKYTRGRYIDGRWVIGGIERGTKKMFMDVVAARDAATLLPLIQRNVAAGSIIQTDEWASYVRLPTLGYIHQTVNHSTNFVDPASGA